MKGLALAYREDGLGMRLIRKPLLFLIPHYPFISHQALCFHTEVVFSKIGTRAKVNYTVLHPAFIPKPYNW